MQSPPDLTQLMPHFTLRTPSVNPLTANLTMQHRYLTLLAALTLVQSGAANAAGLNDTGITGCSNGTGVVTTGVEADSGTHPRQDCRYGRDAAAAALPKVGGGGKGFDFSKIANNGSVLPESANLGSGATDWACTRDNVTGSIWEIKTTSGLRSQNWVYTWYSSITATNGGNVGTAVGGSCATAGRCNTEKFVADVNAASLCGAADWRMPTLHELVSILDYGRTSPSIDPTYFPGTFASEVWSASTYANESSQAWSVELTFGAVWNYYKYRAYHVRLVRAGQ